MILPALIAFVTLRSLRFRRTRRFWCALLCWRRPILTLLLHALTTMWFATLRRSCFVLTRLPSTLLLTTPLLRLYTARTLLLSTLRCRHRSMGANLRLSLFSHYCLWRNRIDCNLIIERIVYRRLLDRALLGRSASRLFYNRLIE
jgi:hypothetical protein